MTPEPGKPSIVVESVFGESRLTISDGEHQITLSLQRDAIASLIEELQIVYDMADDTAT